MWLAVKAMLHSVYDQSDAPAVQAQFDRLLDYVEGKLPQVHEHLDAARIATIEGHMAHHEYEALADVPSAKDAEQVRDLLRDMRTQSADAAACTVAAINDVLTPPRSGAMQERPERGLVVPRLAGLPAGRCRERGTPCYR